MQTKTVIPGRDVMLVLLPQGGDRDGGEVDLWGEGMTDADVLAALEALNQGNPQPPPKEVLFAAIDARPLYTAPSHLVCTISGYRQ
jgi:hypothetical protein